MGRIWLAGARPSRWWRRGAALVLALFFTFTRARRTARQIATSVGAVAALTLGALVVHPLTVTQTEIYHFALNDQTYAILRHFAPRRVGSEGHATEIQARVCNGSDQGPYSNACSSGDDDRLSLSLGPLAERPGPRSGLEAVGAVVGEDGRIVWPGDAAPTQAESDGLRRLDRAPHHLIVAPDGGLIGYGRCTPLGECRVAVQSGDWVVGFTAPDADHISRWMDGAARVLALFDGWRRGNPDCDASF
ncbi:MAG: hypothetical protein AAF376_04550 [Pseudomonadota bacterium]